MANKLGNWVFLSTGDGWQWRRLHPDTGDELERSPRSFAKLLACLSDAQQHGYLPPGHNEPAAARRHRGAG